MKFTTKGSLYITQKYVQQKYDNLIEIMDIGAVNFKFIFIRFEIKMRAHV